jgi:uncharacterized protein (TIGR03084 family)
MAIEYQVLADDLGAETAELERLLEPEDASRWDTATPAPGWRVHDQVSHLAYFDHAATLAAVDPDRFRREAEEARGDADGITARIQRQYADMPSADLLAWFRSARAEMLASFAALDVSTRVPWYGPDMSLGSLLTARIMETWAHGQDVADAFARERTPTRALRHVAYLGVRTLPNSFRARGLPVPDVEVHVALQGHDGEAWAWADPALENRVRGEALDFCLVVTQRRHVEDTGLVIEGPVAIEWMGIAQAFAGPPGPGRSPRRS